MNIVADEHGGGCEARDDFDENILAVIVEKYIVTIESSEKLIHQKIYGDLNIVRNGVCFRGVLRNDVQLPESNALLC